MDRVVIGVLVLVALSVLVAVSALARAEAPIDPRTLERKVLCGYQGWFRCAEDESGGGWRHWSRSSRRIGPDTVTFEMWPDMREYGEDEKYPAGDFKYPDGSQAHLFSSVNAKTVDRHFQWMAEYGIDGVFLQRFLVAASGASTNRVLENVRASAAKSGRVYAICYDLSGMQSDRIYDALLADWKRLVDELKVTKDERYLHHNGKPVLFVWGFYSDRFAPELAHRIIDFFKNDPHYGVTLIGGCQWYWRNEKNSEWARAFRRFDVISPWNVGNVTRIAGEKHAATGYWKADLAEAKTAGMAYLPVIYPGFGWTNLKGKNASNATIPRLGGEFYWRQFSSAADLGVNMAYVAMFDEVDEGTAIFKVTNTPPTQTFFQTYENLPSDWYLRLTGEGSRLIRGETRNQKTLPIKPQ
jgi:hypothetical protein